MPYPTIMQPPPTPDVLLEAQLWLAMPGANALTRRLTAQILLAHGLADDPGPAAQPFAHLVQHEAARLRRETAAASARAQALCQEAKDLCHPPR